MESKSDHYRIAAQIEKDREEESTPEAEQCAARQQWPIGHAVLTAKIYCTFVCFVDLFQSILMYQPQ
jgi:hypothetical protein